MKSIVKTIYFTRDKDDNCQFQKKLKNEGLEVSDRIKYMGEEVAATVKIFEDGRAKMLAIEGFDVEQGDIWI